MPASRLRPLFLLAALAFGPRLAAALPVAITQVERTADAEASATDGIDSDFAEIHFVDATQGPFEWNPATALASVPSGDASAQAWPFFRGEVDAVTIMAHGVAHAGAHARAWQTGYALGRVEVTQRIVFEATADASLQVGGYLSALALVGGTADGVALLEITSLGGVADPDPLLIRHVVDDGQLDLDFTFEIRSGMAYQILSVARANADAFSFGTGNLVSAFSFEVTEVPEPGTAALLLLGTLALGARRTHR